MSVKIFFCYAHEDEPLLKRLKRHLSPLRRQGLIDVWHDRDISAGNEWEQEINQHLNSAQIILLLVSPDFMDSDYCYGIEMKRSLERHEQKEAHVIPIILRPVYWQGVLGKLQALPKDSKPVKSWRDQDKAFVDVVTGILIAIEQLPMRSSETTETILMKLGKTPEVPIMETSDAVPTSKQPLLSVISMPTLSSPLVPEGKEILPALYVGEQELPNWDDFPPPIVNHKIDLFPLTVEKVKSVWDRVLKRVKQRSPTTAAMLKYYNIVGVEGTVGQSVIIIQAQKQGHYNYVHENDRSIDIEWALTTELNRQCKVYLLPPLSVEQVKSAWDRAVKRVKQRSPTTAAMLKYYNIVGVEGTVGQSVIIIQAQKQGHYNYIHENDRSIDIEWALTTEFGRQCKVRLLPPESP